MMQDCLFCKITRHEIPATILYEDDEMMVVKDIDPKAVNHHLLLLKSHFESVLDMTEEQAAMLSRSLMKIRNLVDVLGLEGGFRMVINQGDHAGQTVHHLHVHILSGQPMGWTPA